ncbi:ATP-binding protein [uncultured Flavobacterium sp.]|uniref:sensor histidine kinase n=1 Tax=uncultured Flavobacterium sp. TaxID=165435 RepID=UPI0025E7EF3D|nr:ATP-binding protein [uncultured Flavobacterium sp.]
MQFTYIGLAALFGVSGWLLLKIARQKRIVTTLEKMMVQQKMDIRLQESGRQGLDIIIENQYLERLHSAQELHDSLGSLLAALKINFENLRLRHNALSEEDTRIYEKTDEMIESAYQKVRGLAQAKNMGVPAREGLLPSLRKLAEKMPEQGNVNIQVTAFGLDTRLDNAFEITIFRMIRELAENAVRHSHATEVLLQLTGHNDTLNLMVEDNGIGIAAHWDIKGSGLKGIQQKVAQLGGDFTIDTAPGKGTTIIIDLPL